MVSEAPSSAYLLSSYSCVWFTSNTLKNHMNGTLQLTSLSNLKLLSSDLKSDASTENETLLPP